MNRIATSLLLITASVCLSSCGTARTMVEKPVSMQQSPVPANAVCIQRGEDTIPVPEATQEVFERVLRNNLYTSGGLKEGNDLTVQYRFIQYNEGNRFARYVLGGMGSTGEASMTVEVTYLDADNNEVGKTRTEGRIDSGLFGGSSDQAVTNAAREIADYTKNVVRGSI